MALSVEQLATLKAAILAETDAAFVTARSQGATGTMAEFYRQPSSPAFYVWKTDAATSDIYDAVDWAKMTPADAPDGTAIYTNRALLCQAKQLNLQILLQGRDRVDATKLKVRQGLTDSLQNVPAGVGGALLDAGWIPVKGTLYRQVNRGERLFATGTGTTGVPGLAVFAGAISSDDVSSALSN
jgi:hypothetical protein